MVSPTTWEQFEKDYDYIIKFGESRFQEKLEQRDQPIDSSIFKESIKEAYRSWPELGQVLEAAFDHELDAAIRAHHSQRGDVRPQDPTPALRGQEPTRRQRFEMPDWAAKMDFADNPAINDTFNADELNKAISNYNNDPTQTNKNALLNQFKMKMGDLKKKLKEEYDYQLNLKATPTVPAPKPNIPR